MMNREAKLNKAYKLFQEGMKMVDIAKEVGVAESTVRVWKKRYWTNATFQESNVAKEIKETIENDNLTDKQKLFCIYYIKCFNATKAYQKAYECSYNNAMTEGSKSLRNPKIEEEIKRLKQAKLNKAYLSEEDIFQKYIDIAFSDVNDYIKVTKKTYIEKDSEGNPIRDEYGKVIVHEYKTLDISESAKVDGSIIKEISEGKSGIKIKLEDKMRALEWLSNHMDMLTTHQVQKLKQEKESFELRKKEVESKVW